MKFSSSFLPSGVASVQPCPIEAPQVLSSASTTTVSFNYKPKISEKKIGEYTWTATIASVPVFPDVKPDSCLGYLVPQNNLL
jgi:hypothetical protein